MHLEGKCHCYPVLPTTHSRSLSININEFGEANIEAPANRPFRWECHAYRIPLKTLDALADDRFVPGSPEHTAHMNTFRSPFQHTCSITSSSELRQISLDDALGDPHLTCLKGDTTIVWKSLNRPDCYFCTVEPLAGLNGSVSPSVASSWLHANYKPGPAY